MLNKSTPHSIHNKRKRSITIEGVNDASDHCYTFKLEKEAAANEQFIRQICKLYEEEKLCDVTFRVGKERNLYKAHRVVLASANSFLSGLILSGLSESTQDVIDLPETDPTLFKCILDYLYSVQIEISYSNIIPLLGLANCYNMECLRDRLADILGSNLSISNCCSIFAAADAYNCEHLKSQAQEIIFSNFAAASKTEAFYNLSQALIEYVLRSDEILDCDEALLFEAATRWIEHRPQEREPHCLPLLSLVRFPLMDSCFLSDVIKGHPLMKGAERSNLLMEAFEHHALLACGRTIGVATARAKKRRQSCSFTRSTLLNGHNDAVSCVVSLGDWLISGSWDSSIKVWATDTWICVRTLSDHTGAIRGLCVCNDKVVSCSDDGTIKVWSPGSWTCVRSMDGHDGTAANVVVSCRGRLASAGDDGTIKLWGSTSWACEVTVHNLHIQAIAPGNNTGGVVAMQQRLDAELLANVEEREPVAGRGGARGRGRNAQEDDGEGVGVGQRRVRRRQAGADDVEETDEDDEEVDLQEDEDEEEGEEEEEEAPQPRVGVMSLEVYEEKLFSGGDDSIVRIWNTNNWTCECILRAHSDEIWSIKMNGSDLITGSVDGTIRVWRQRQRQSQVVLHRSNSSGLLSTTSLGHVALNSSSSSSAMLTQSSFGDGEPAAYSYYAGATGSASTPDPPVRSSSFTAEADCEWVCEYTVTNDGPVYSLCCLDGKVVSAGASNKISIWRPAMERSETWTLHRWFETEEAGIWSLTVCKGRLISGGDDGTVRVWT